MTRRVTCVAEWTSPTREIPDAGVSAAEAVTRYIEANPKRVRYWVTGEL